MINRNNNLVKKVSPMIVRIETNRINRKAPILMITNQSPIKKIHKWKVMTSRMKMLRTVVMIPENKSQLQVISSLTQARNVLINCAPLKKYTKNWDRRYKMPNIDFCVRHVTRIMSIMHFVSFANKFMRIQDVQKMMINGLAVMIAIVG